MIRLLFTDENTISQSIVRFFTRSKFSHVDTIMPDGSLFGARPFGGVKRRPPNYHKFSKEMVVELDFDDSEYMKFLLEQEGKPYDWRANAFWFFDRDMSAEGSWMCSELVTAGLVRCGFFKKPLFIASSRISPADLLLAISAKGEMK